jgi:ribosomal protein S18 acetylase RimI-like enzyme
MQAREFRPEDIAAVRAFTDRTIGTGYYSEPELQEYYRRSVKDGRVCSLVLVDEGGEIRGLRLTCPPGNWSHGKGHGLSPALWKTQLSETAYFQSLFIDPDLAGRGWGKKLSMHALDILREVGAKSVVTHSWKESPHDSSGRYLRAMGFELVKAHPLYWNKVDYTCTRCGKPCMCTAEEMIKYL